MPGRTHPTYTPKVRRPGISNSIHLPTHDLGTGIPTRTRPKSVTRGAQTWVGMSSEKCLGITIPPHPAFPHGPSHCAIAVFPSRLSTTAIYTRLHRIIQFELLLFVCFFCFFLAVPQLRYMRLPQFVAPPVKKYPCRNPSALDQSSFRTKGGKKKKATCSVTSSASHNTPWG
ncbi:hypothetical protein K440DRAFT_31512 [Wilcoxina mikolae CBS 423.85]|nr:hypothetical protein K440DRAFT_31512 [Wilcoxina mikolae CBS 423.85]